MSFWEWVRLMTGCLMIAGGLFVFITAVIGNYRFPEALMRMHAAALGDTLGILLIAAGILVLCFATEFAVKVILIIPLMWASGSACSHMIARMVTNEKQQGERKARKK